MRNARGLIFDDPPLQPLRDTSQPQVIEESGKEKITIVREGDEMIITTVERRSAIVDFLKIVKHAEIASCADSYPPWEDDEYYEHEDIRVSSYASARNCDDMRSQIAAEARASFHNGHSYHIILLDDHERSDLHDWYRRCGCSKQVAYELVAAVRRRIISQIVEWRRDGWCAYTATLQFKEPIPYDAGCCGFYTEEDADEWCYEELTCALEAIRLAGYTVTNVPDRYKPKRWLTLRNGRRFTQWTWQVHLKENLDSQIEDDRGASRTLGHYIAKHARKLEKHARRKPKQPAG